MSANPVCLECGSDISHLRLGIAKFCNKQCWSKSWTRRNPELRREIGRRGSKKWYANNCARAKASNRKWKAEHHEEWRAYMRQWHRDHPESAREQFHKSRARKSMSAGSFDDRDFERIVKAQRGRCAECRHKTQLTRDHIFPLSRGGSNMSINIQGLCRSCNSRKKDRLPQNVHPSLFERLER